VTDTDEYLAMNPNGLVPTIRDGDGPPLWESGAILRYLASQYADETFWPSDPELRVEVDKWAEWSKINIALRFTGPIFWKAYRTPIEKRDPEAIGQAIKHFEASLAIADRQLQTSPYLAGQHFTLADIQFAHVLFRYYDLPIDRAPLEAVANYYSRLSKRAAFIEHVAVSYEELADSK